MVFLFPLGTRDQLQGAGLGRGRGDRKTWPALHLSLNTRTASRKPYQALETRNLGRMDSIKKL